MHLGEGGGAVLDGGVERSLYGVAGVGLREGQERGECAVGVRAGSAGLREAVPLGTERLGEGLSVGVLRDGVGFEHFFEDEVAAVEGELGVAIGAEAVGALREAGEEGGLGEGEF